MQTAAAKMQSSNYVFTSNVNISKLRRDTKIAHMNNLVENSMATILFMFKNFDRYRVCELNPIIEIAAASNCVFHLKRHFLKTESRYQNFLH